MPYYRVAIEGDGLAMGLLARAGIQNVVDPAHWIEPEISHGVVARLRAENSAAAQRRVIDAVGDDYRVRRETWREASDGEPGRVEIPAWSAGPE